MRWFWSKKEEKKAANAIFNTFLVCFATVSITGAVTLMYAPKADVQFADMGDEAVCLRAERRADMPIVYISIGSPMQRLSLLLDLGSVADPEEESLLVFSTRLHKSLSMACKDLTPPLSYNQECHDLALVSLNGSSGDQSLVHTKFTYQNDKFAYSSLGGKDASLAGLDGRFRLSKNKTFWLTTTHFCFAPIAPLPEESRVLNVKVVDGKMKTTQQDLLAYDTSLAFDTRCNESLINATVRLFPSEASSEALQWLSLSGKFLYEYGSSILEKRRRVVEAGEKCSAILDELQHQRNIYHTDCGGLDLGQCMSEASVPYRRLSTRRIRIDIGEDANVTIISEHAESLNSIKQNYTEALFTSLARLFVLVLTAAVVFVRGSQNATSSRWLITNVVDTLRCRKAHAVEVTPQSVILKYDRYSVMTDGFISASAWLARFFVLVYAAKSFVDDGQSMVVWFQSIGLFCSFAQFLLRHALELSDGKHAPITALGGPMSVIDVTSAVLMLFSDAPLIGSSGQNFAATGRLLIGLLISISVCTRICFSASMVSAMAVSANNGERQILKCYRITLCMAVILWTFQGLATSGTLALLCVNPASISLARSQTGNTDVIKYALFFGLLCTSLPTYTKVGLRVFQHECKP